MILAGGKGMRLAPETISRPKPMIEIGGEPILWHIMKMYEYYGFDDFIVCLGYQGNIIRSYFENYSSNHSDIKVNTSSDTVDIIRGPEEKWTVNLIQTGLQTMTGGRLKRIAEFLDDESFMMTYGDGVSDINLKNLVEFHESHGRLATVTAVSPEGRFGKLEILENGVVERFKEKQRGDDGWINAGYYVLNNKVIDLISDDSVVWEEGPMSWLSNNGQLVAFRHSGFWHSMDTFKDKILLEELWKSNPPWRVWSTENVK